jgi:hypothetical protein
MPSFPHRVRRQRWVVRACSAESAFRIRKHLRDEWANLSLPVFEKAFDQAAGGEEILRIPKIELLLKFTSEKELTSLLPQCIHHQLAEQLGKLGREPPHIDGKSAGCYASAEKQSRFQILLHYFRTGSVPWEAANRTASELAVELKEVCRVRGQEVQNIVRNEQVSAAFYFRLFQLIPASNACGLIEDVLEGIQCQWKAPLLEVIVLLLLGSCSEHLSRHLQLQLAALFLSEARAAQNRENAPDLTAIARSILPAKSGAALAQFISSLTVSAAALFRLDRRLGPSLTAGPSLSSTSPLYEEAESQGPSIVNSSAIAEAFQNHESAALAPQAANHLKPEYLTKFPLIVTHAGLILLHPFLPRFFECTQVKEEIGARLSPFLLARAAGLLHFLATGREDIFEFDLAFIKVLLGLEPDTTLCASEGLIGDRDKEEAESLLESAITHWAALKRTSVTGFRSSFLNRQASLREDENGWRLQVERLAFDVLLAKLPWSISVVKLPWMTRPIYTEW